MIITYAFYETFLSKTEKYLSRSCFYLSVIKLPSNIWSHIPCTSLCYYWWTFWALVIGQLFHKCTGFYPLHGLLEDLSPAILSLSPTSSFSPSTRSFPLDYKHAAISHTNIPSHDHTYTPATISFLCSPLQQNSLQVRCLFPIPRL